MSLTDKVIKNTYYLFIAQFAGFIFPLILTPFIISYIGETAFGIYALVLGFAGIFGLFDMSLSSSFIKFISEHYNKKQYEELKYVINTGIVFYTVFSMICCIIGIIFMDSLLSLINIPNEYLSLAKLAFIIGLAAFFITNSFGIFNSVLISLQKMYLTSIFQLGLSLINLILVIILLINGFGLAGLLILHIIIISLSIFISYIAARKAMPEMKINFFYFRRHTFKKMANFGIQMQVSKLASFASEKYDEYLLAFFSVIGNVTYYNIAGKVARTARLIPYQLVPQVAPVAAELNAKEDNEKLLRLFNDTSKYLTLISVPVFIYIILYADLIINTWMGEGFEISAYLLRILAIGQLINMIFSAPGNSIIPNIGIPKYQMYEGLIFLSINIVLSYILIKNFGIIGAAYGNAISISIGSIFVFFASSNFFKIYRKQLIRYIYIKPVIITLIGSIVTYFFYYLISYHYLINSRLKGIIIISLSFTLFIFIYIIGIYNSGYLNKNDKLVLLKILNRIFNLRIILEKRNLKKVYKENSYKGELVSFFIITHNRLKFLKKCVNSLIPTIKNLDYELIIWDNNSADGTAEYLKTLQHERIRIIFSKENIGTNAKSQAVSNCKGEFIFGIDDDVLEFPENWAEKMIEAYKSVPRLGYLSADVIQNQYTNGAKPSEELYYDLKINNSDKIIQIGPAGGWCFLVSKNIIKKIGNFSNIKRRIFFSEDGDFLNRLKRKGYRFGILKGVKVFHATGEYYNKEFSDIFNVKMVDYYKNKATKYHIMNKIKNYFDIIGLFNMFLDYSERHLLYNSDKQS